MTFLLVLAAWLVPLITNGASAAYPDLTSSSRTVQYPMLIFAAGIFAAANLIGLQPHRHHTLEFEQALSLPQWQRAAALCLATIGPALLGLALAGAQVAVQTRQRGAAGSVQMGELLTVPAVIVLAGILGQTVADLSRRAATGFVTLSVLAIISYVGLSSSSSLRWLTFVAGEDPFETPPLPISLVDRSEWWHGAWLIGLAAMAATVTLWQAGLRTKPTAMVATVLLVGVASIGVMQLRGPSADATARLRAAATAPARMQVCETHEAVTYCAFPEFRSRIPAWAAMVEAQVRTVPAGVAVPPMNVRQHLPIKLGEHGVTQPLPLAQWAADDAVAGTPGALPVSTRWAAGGADSFDETEVLGFSVQVAARLVTGEPLAAGSVRVCGGRGALVLWLAASTTSDARRALETVLSHTSGGGLDFSILNADSGVFLGPEEAALGLAMLDGDRPQVRAKVVELWAQLANPRTTVEQAASLLGLSPRGPALAEDSITCE
ncbi:hypothetical protein BG844_07585 [Couchioplanes caeruleus subsp. caeruleus]|uniref:Uncharacterized protein n=2 Tax=Couchioplanes caeruleus TaxID=56438 RepID=A0A1K0GCA5_9ACTN|nr:hypothetical protein BG844_07585 [Couchioplanes caeruleus subsp. caeruleus]